MLSLVFLPLFFGFGALLGALVGAYLGCLAAELLQGREGKVARKAAWGAFLGKFLEKLSMQNNLPKFMKTKKFKNALLTLMVVMLSLSIIHSGGQIDKIAFALFRFMFASFVVGVLMGVFFKPRSWCQVCPMGHATGLITDIKKAPKQVSTPVKNDKIA